MWLCQGGDQEKVRIHEGINVDFCCLNLNTCMRAEIKLDQPSETPINNRSKTAVNLHLPS